MDADSRRAVDGRWADEKFFARVRSELPLVAMWGAREYRVRYRQSMLGVLWSVVQPAALLATYGTVLSLVLKVRTEDLPYVSFAYSGLVGWTFVANAVNSSFPSMINAMSLTSKVYFPREVIPLSAVTASSLDLAIGTTILMLVALIQRVGLSGTLVAIVPIDLVLFLYVAAISVFGAAITVFIRDLRHVLPVVMQIVFFASPVMYPASVVPEQWRWVHVINPIAVVAEATRDVVLRHVWPRWPILGIHAVVAVLLLCSAIVYTRSVEPRLVDVA